MKEIVRYVTFDVTPIVCVRVIEKTDTEKIKQEKKDYPFKLHNDVPVHIITNKRAFSFTIPSKYIWNGADIPRFFWRLIGSKTDNAFLMASMVHDYLLDNKKDVYTNVLKSSMPMKEYRRLTSLAFREVLKNSGEKTIKANIMAWCVDVYQMNHRKEWNEY